MQYKTRRIKMAENAKLTIVSNQNPEAAEEPSNKDLVEFAKNEFLTDITDEELNRPECRATKEMLTQLWLKKKTDAAEAEAEKIARAERETLEKKMKQLNGKLFNALHPPKEKEILTGARLTALLPKEPSLEDRLENLKKDYSHLFPGWAFNPDSHEEAMGIRGYLIDILIRFKRYMGEAPDEEYRKNLGDKVRTIQNRIDAVSLIVKEGYKLDPTDASNFCSRDTYKDVRAKLEVETELMKLCAPPETPTERQERKKLEAEELKKRQATELEREQMVADIMVHMLSVPYFEKLGNDQVQALAKRTARKFEGKTPEARLKQAALEKRGAEKGENRQLGIALAQAASLSPAEIDRIFPAPKGEKKQKKQ